MNNQINELGLNEFEQTENFHIISFDEIQPEDLHRVGGKAFNLGIMAQNNLPVPPGFCVTTEAYDYYLKTGQLPSSLPDIVRILKGKLGGKVAIRSSATCEDGQKLSMAGVFTSIYVSEDEEIEKALNFIYSQASSEEVEKYLALHGMTTRDVKMGIVVQELIEPDNSGIIYDESGRDSLLVQYVDGFGSAIVDGITHGSSVIIDKETKSIIQSSGYEQCPLKSDQVENILSLTRRVRDTVGYYSQDIEYAYKNGSLYILQARPLTSELGNVELEETIEDTLEKTKRKLKELAQIEKIELGTNNVIFSDSNFTELLPRPTEMDYGIFAYIFTGSDMVPGGIQLGRVEMGYPLGEESIGFMHYIGGKPYFSIARDAATFYAGFPSTRQEYFATLVTEYLEEIQHDSNKGHYPEMGLYLQDPTLRDLKTRFGDKAEDYYQVYMHFTKQMSEHAESFLDGFRTNLNQEMDNFTEKMKERLSDHLTPEELVEYSTEILEHLRTVSCVSFVKSARLGFYYSQKMQNELKRLFNFSDREVEETFGRLSQGLDGSAITDVNIEIVKASTFDEAITIATRLVGHYSTGEMLQVRHARLKDDKEALANYVLGIRRNSTYSEDFERQRKERIETQEKLIRTLSDKDQENLEKIISAAQTYMALRETVKYKFTREYDLLRDALEILGSRLGLEDGDIYYIYPRELPKLIKNSKDFHHLICARKQAFANYPSLDLPSVIRESDIDTLGITNDKATEFTEINGKFLSEGEAFTGVIVNLDEFATHEELEKVLKEYRDQSVPIILVASQMNLSHDPYINLANGIIIENAGIVSHGAQRARELGRGAIGGIKSKHLRTGLIIDFDPMNRKIRKVVANEEN